MRKKVYMFSEAIFMNPYQEENDGIVSLTDAGVKEIQAHKIFTVMRRNRFPGKNGTGI